MSDSNVGEDSNESSDSLAKRKEELKKNLRTAIIKGLEDWEDNNLATFDFKKAGIKTNPLPISIIYGGIGTRKNSFKLKYNNAEDKEDHRISIDFNKDNELRCGIQGFFNNPVGLLDKEDESIAPSDELQGIKNATDINFLAQKWFPKGGDNIPGLTLHYSLKKYWPEYHPDNNQLKSWTANHPQIPQDETSANNKDLSKDWAAYILACTIWRVLTKWSYDNDNGICKFPYYRDYMPKQAITLNPSGVMNNLKEKGLLFPWHILEAACSSLNSGKNIIFVGPPGCGKSELALALAAEAGYKTIPVTASSAWSTNELIGRYMPTVNKDSKSHLKFYEGFFLQAITNSDKNSWLIIDELNRADIDSCFGELFSVLAGQPALLPFETYSEDSEKNTTESKRIVILPFKEEKEQDNILKNIGIEADNVDPYQVGAGFRIIGTMNDADASKLHQLSYAFQRRFNIIRIDAPDAKTIEDIIKNRLEKVVDAVENTNRKIYALNKKGRAVFDRTMRDLLHLLFADENATDLIDLRIVGVAQVNDIISFVTGSMSGEKDIIINGDDASYKGLIHSFTAIGIVMNVFPQLEAFIGQDDVLRRVWDTLIRAFEESKMYRLEPSEASSSNSKSFKIVPAQEKNKEIKITEYFKTELKRQFRYSRIDIKDMINIKED